MSGFENFELVPFEDTYPERAGRELYECLQDPRTRAQLEQFMPAPLDAYGASPKEAVRRVEEVADASRDEDEFHPFVQSLDGYAIGVATIDNRLEVHRHRFAKRLYVGKVAVHGPNTASWIGAEYQGNGYGGESLRRRIQLARDMLGYGAVWTVVEHKNVVSMHNVRARGLEPAHEGSVWVAGHRYEDATVFQDIQLGIDQS